MGFLSLSLSCIVGVTGGSEHTHAGGGGNYQCLPLTPQWGKFTDGHQSKSYMYGSEYELTSNSPFPKSLQNMDVPCAACYVPRATSIMIPAWKTCPGGWEMEYWGYLMSAYHAHKGRTTYECVDEHPEADNAGAPNQDGALFYNVESVCGSLPCPPYVNGRELTCVVCTKWGDLRRLRNQGIPTFIGRKRKTNKQ